MKTFFYTFGLLALVLIFAPDVLAQGAVTVEPLTGIGVKPEDQANIGSFVNKLYQYGVGIGAILAVLVIMYGGFQYMTSEVVGNKSEGRAAITRAILGLMLLLSPVIVFGVINQDILNLDLNLSRLSSEGSQGGGGIILPEPGEIDSEICSAVQWNTTKFRVVRDGFFFTPKNIISPIRNGDLPDEAVMSNRELENCCVLTGGIVKTKILTASGNTDSTQTYCDLAPRLLSARVIVTLDDENGTVIAPPLSQFNLSGKTGAAICEKADDKQNKGIDIILSLFNDKLLTFKNPTLSNIGETPIKHIDLAPGRSIKCDFY
ncbi:hypothetical protein COB87_001020 [Candidatus Wolfebacteria bacterium]|nr:hypothetical protein [Candidatus Wolfebacteria bacterium]